MSSNYSEVNLPTDADAQAVQCLAPSTIVNDTVTSVSQVHALPTSSDIVEIAVSTDTWLLFGTSGSTVANSTGMFFASGASAVYRVPDGTTHLAVIRDSADGRVSITRMV